MGPTRFDVWLYAIGHVGEEPSTQALSRVFGISEQVAEQLLAALPRIVTHDATDEKAARIVNALTAIGGRCAAVAKPMRPMPVLMVGTPAAEVDSQSLRKAAPLNSQDTLTLGTQFPPATSAATWPERTLAQSTSQAPFSAIAVLDPQVQAPLAPTGDVAVAPFDALAVLDPQGDAPLALTRNLAEWNEALVSHRPRAASARVPHALALATASDLGGRLALPAADAPAQIPTGMRSPSQRAGAPQRLGRRSSGPPPRIDAQLPLNPVTALLQIHKQAQRSSWRSALHGHPVAGFLLVLCGTSAAFLLLYAAYRATHMD